MAEEARRRFMEFTGLDCVVVHTKTEKNYFAKLELPTMFNQTVVYFDADLWFLRSCDLSGFDNQPEFIAVRDPGTYDDNHFPKQDCVKLGLDPKKYFNSGMFVFNQRHHDAFHRARDLVQTTPLKDFGEQSYLNAGVQILGHPIRLLNSSYNYIPFALKHNLDIDECEEPFTAHAAGYGHELKAAALKHYAERYSPEREKF